VTAADRVAEEIVLEALARLAPGAAVVAEEAAAAGRLPPPADTFFLVDALDGTRDFLNGRPDFTVNVGFVEAGRPAAGIVHAPASGRLWLGAAEGAFAGDGKAWAPIRVRRPPESGLEIVASRLHPSPETDAFIAKFPGARLVSAGSSIKFCLLAEGKADLYPRLGPTSQWDTAAGDAVLRAAGGRVLTLDGEPLRYGPREGTGVAAYLNPWFVATAWVDPFRETATN
jgi:3'(2'), 5'-bisphosphate nucleotidase